jgi:hypothetical protein
MPGPQPSTVWLYRLIHLDNLPMLLSRDALHAPNATPQDGQVYRVIHDIGVQASRHAKAVPCGPGGTVHDYVPFYFGPLSPMLLKLKSGQVEGYAEGQGPLLYLVTRLEDIQAASRPFIFTDGHSLAAFTQWFERSADLGRVDWTMVSERYWADRPEDNDRMRRKQAEFLVWQSLPWSAIRGIATCSDATRRRVTETLIEFAHRHQPPLKTKRDWYY